MSKLFTLSLERVNCIFEEFEEPGSDEMYLLGFGISKGGHQFTIRPLSMGSFSEGDTSGSGYPKTLVDIQVPDSKSLVSTCIWLFERDSGGLANAGDQLEADFNNYLNAFLTADANLGLSADASLYYAFAKTMHLMEFSLAYEAYNWWNSDDVLDHLYHDHLPVDPIGRTDTYERVFNGQGATYALTFRYQLAPAVIVVPD